MLIHYLEPILLTMRLSYKHNKTLVKEPVKKSKKKSFNKSFLAKVLLNFFRKAVLNNIWLVSPIKNNGNKYTHEMMYLVVYCTYVIINASWNTTKYRIIENIRNQLLADDKLWNILTTTKESLINMSSNNWNKKSSEIFYNCYDHLWLSIDFPTKNTDPTWYINKRINEISNRKNVKELNSYTNTVSSLRINWKDYIFNAFHSLVFFRVWNMNFTSDDIVIDLFISAFDKILSRKQLQRKFIVWLMETLDNYESFKFFEKKGSTLKKFFNARYDNKLIIDNIIKADILEYIFKEYKDFIITDILKLKGWINEDVYNFKKKKLGKKLPC